MARKLVEAQEKERARIARELHDDINQRLAVLAVELEQLKENPSEVETRVQEQPFIRKRRGTQPRGTSRELHCTRRRSPS
jgi:signal transduction histidine kinase